jgi:ferredoxin
MQLDQPLPRFDLKACQGTGWCIRICPTECLEFWNDVPGLKYPQACVSCGACELVCPTDAIVVSSAGIREPLGDSVPQNADAR